MKKTPNAETSYRPEPASGRENRLREIRRAVNHPERLDDITVDMLYSIISNA